MLRPVCIFVAIATAALGCGSTDPEPTPGADAAVGSDDAAVGADAAQANLDLDIFDSILAGQIAADEGLLQIAHSNGLPIRDGDEFVFARLDDGAGPYNLSSSFDNWGLHAMSSEAGMHWIRIEIAAPDEALYKFVDGAQNFAADPLARRYGYDQNGEYSLVRAAAAHLERWPAIGGTNIEPRTVRVWRPASPARHLYLQDGQNLFNPNSPFGGWQLAGQLGANTLAIAIDNTPARMDEYTHVTEDLGGNIGGNGDAYADFVVNVVMPLIEDRYGDATHRGVLGSSLGGLISLHIALRHPDVFDFAGSMSGTLGWGSIGVNNETLLHRFRAAEIQPFVVFLDSGGNEGSGCVDADGDTINDDGAGDRDNYCTTRQLADELALAGYVYDDNLYHYWEPNQPHNEMSWASRVFRPLAIFEAL